MMVRSVGIIGLGLIGGSLARDLAARGLRVYAADRDSGSVGSAVDAQIVHAVLDDALATPTALDALVLAVPVSSALEIIEVHADQLRRIPLITDVCSTKDSISQAAVRAGLGDCFVGSHPLAGDHRSGWAFSRTDLFRDAPVYVCPTPGTPAGSIAGIRALWESVGATVELIDPAAHDRLLAWTSHLPQVTATALASALAGTGITLDRLGPGGRDMTRLAGSSPDVWVPIALDNAGHLAPAIAALELELGRLRDALEHSDAERIRDFFTIRTH